MAFGPNEGSHFQKFDIFGVVGEIGGQQKIGVEICDFSPFPTSGARGLATVAIARAQYSAYILTFQI